MNLPVAQYWRLLLKYLKPQRGRVALLALLLLSGIGLQLLNPQILRAFIDEARAGVETGSLIRIALFFIGVALTQQLVSVLATYVGEHTAWQATNGLRRDLALHCLRLDLGFHHARTPGTLIERIDGDVSLLATFFSTFVLIVLGNLLLLAGVLLLLLREEWRIGLALSALSAVGLIVMSRVRELATPHWVAGRQATADFAGFIEERLAGMEDIRASGAGGYAMWRFYGLIQVLYHAYRAVWIWGSAVGVTGRIMTTLGIVITLGLSTLLYRRGAMTIGTVYLVYAYAGMLWLPLRRITDQIAELQRAEAAITRVEELMQTPNPIQDGPGASFPRGALLVEFDGVSFGYGSDQMIVRDISFALAPGRHLGLLGRTGSGKTTLTRLLFRLYDPEAGAIRLGGVEIRQARLDELRERIGMVTQEVQLFRASVRDNLTFFDHHISDARILEAIEALGLMPWFASLPDGLDTPLGVSGRGLSAGEAQLLAFTRVFLKDPGLVVLDEASSRLDPATERLIERAVDRLLAGRTANIIAHRLGTVRQVDEIMVMESGQIVEHGAREQLATDSTSRYATLLRTGLEEALA
ncbi:MAG TPA: ABC transporter ATP-binding protein [Ardenticatenaceae bacterium]|nr:ABC transporter ATP-binding protein [Ardenticatenaceae bacterium]